MHIRTEKIHEPLLKISLLLSTKYVYNTGYDTLIITQIVENESNKNLRKSKCIFNYQAF